MRVGEWTATIFNEYQGQRYAFCSQRCLERFKEDPQSYVNRKRGVMRVTSPAKTNNDSGPRQNMPPPYQQG
ncbi:MAG: YHS domain-containing protein [Gammaproteobacteria bacterium]|nr:YHS domain-containing protein [Gammaproteobacteria bacterium]